MSIARANLFTANLLDAFRSFSEFNFSSSCNFLFVYVIIDLFFIVVVVGWLFWFSVSAMRIDSFVLFVLLLLKLEN